MPGRWTFSFCALLLAVPLYLMAQAGVDEPKLPPAPVPTLKATARTLDEFTPLQWKVLSKAVGDLNGDGLPDLAFVVRGTNKALILPKSEAQQRYKDEDTNPYIFAVAFAQAGGGYRLIAQNSAFLPRHQESQGDDMFGEGGTLEIKRGVLSVEFGGMLLHDDVLQKYLFRFQHGRMELIGYDNDGINRVLQRDEHYTVNYSTGVQIFITSMPGEKDTMKKTMLHNKPPLPLEKVGSADDFNYFEQ